MVAAGTVSGDRDAAGGDAPFEQEAVAGHHVFQRGRERMFRRPPIAERQRARTRRTPDRRRQRTMAVDRSRYVAAAVQKQDRAGRIGCRRGGPFRLDAIGIDPLQPEIRRDAIMPAQAVEPLAPLREPSRTRTCGQDRTNGVDLRIGHGHLLYPSASAELRPSMPRDQPAVGEMDAGLHLPADLSRHGWRGGTGSRRPQIARDLHNICAIPTAPRRVGPSSAGP
jgi:hypothetical protein